MSNADSGAGAGPPVAYLDHAATTPLRPEVAEAMAPFAGSCYGNASGSHRLARQARAALEDAREVVAGVVGADPSEVVFTSGGTEADNLAVLGALEAAGDRRPGPAAVVCSAVEHAAVLAPCRAAVARAHRTESAPLELREAPVDADGAVNVAALGPLLGDEVVVVSVMLANNEVGTVQPLAMVAEEVRRRAPAAVLHTDAVQAAPWMDLATAAAPADLVSLSAHKLGGPKGVGTLVVRRGTPLAPLLHGGGQERERRSGTHDVGGAVGLATALALVAAERADEGARVRTLRDRLADGVLAAVGGAVETVPRHRVLPGHCHLCFEGVDREELLVLLDDGGVCASAGSACASGALEPSHVLTAMGVPPGRARGAVRFTLGHASTDADVDRALATVVPAVAPAPGLTAGWTHWPDHQPDRRTDRQAGQSWQNPSMRVLVAMSGGVDSSVAAALLVAEGHEVVGATLKLWGGPSDAGCCSVGDVDDARRVAQQLGIAHHVFNMAEEFEARVVAPYVAAHAAGRTPNPCIECNRHIKFDRLLARADRLGFDALATGHHARVAAPTAPPDGPDGTGAYRLLRGADAAKDQSYVLAMLGQAALARLVLPVGRLTKGEVRHHATHLGLRTAGKPDSQDVCFVGRAEGREGFLGHRLALHPGQVVDRRTGQAVGQVSAVELVTVGQRRGMGHGSDGRRRYVVGVDVAARRVVVDGPEAATTGRVVLDPATVTWVGRPLAPGAAAVAQVSAHGRPAGCVFEADAAGPCVRFASPQRPVAPGQTVALYDPTETDSVLGAGVAA